MSERTPGSDRDGGGPEAAVKLSEVPEGVRFAFLITATTA
jgi:hypothetical protein